MEDLKFYDEEHKKFYKEHTEGKKLDNYNKSLIYLLGLIEETRNNFLTLYDEITREIKINAMNEGWQTGTSLSITKLAFNLFNGYCGLEDNEARYYTPEYIFCYNKFLPYFFEGIKLRFEIKENKELDTFIKQ